MQKHGDFSLKTKLDKYAYRKLMDLFETSDDNLPYSLRFSNYDDFILPIEIEKSQLSNGEKQIFVMALYWSIMRQSKNDLPFIIDTPFARIDSEHRDNITQYFFTQLPGQLFILSTNEELGLRHLESIKEQISDMYMLEYSNDQQTRVLKNEYFGGQAWDIN